MLFLWSIFCAFVGCLLGMRIDRKGFGLALGFLLGPIGWIIILFLNPVAAGETDNSGIVITCLVLSSVVATALIVSMRGNQEKMLTLHSQTERAVLERKLQRDSGFSHTASRGPAAAPEPNYYVPPTPYPRERPTPRPVKSAADVQREILQKYGGKR